MPWIEAGTPKSRIAESIAACAALSDPPGGRLNEIVAAMRPLWWLTWVAVWLLTYVAKADTGTIVSAAVLSALPLDVPPRLLDIALVAWLASAFALSALVLEEVACGADDRYEGRHAADRAARHLRLLRAGRIAGGRAEENPIELLRILPVLRRHLHHHEVLVVWIVDGRDGALAEGVVEHVVDLIRREAVARRRVAVDC